MSSTVDLTRVLEAEALSPKRLASGRGVDGWYPYYAGFSIHFARRVLEHVAVPRSARVLDPWNGAGTTTCAAFELGLDAVGIDLNPAAGTIAAGKLAALAIEESSMRRGVELLAQKFTRRVSVDSEKEDPLRAWLDGKAAELMRSLVREAVVIGEHHRAGASGVQASVGTTPMTSFLLLCLLRSARELAIKRSWSNPTWVRAREPGSLDPIEWRERFRSTALGVLDDAKRRMVKPGGRVWVATGDAGDLSRFRKSFDVVLTSPPYCTRIDYAVTMGFELAALGHGHGAKFRRLREQLMGTPVIRTGGSSQCGEEEIFAGPVASLLDRIATHSSHASAGYYYKNYVQYFSDAQKAMREIRERLAPDGVCVLVVQNSYYKEIEVDLPELYAAMGRAVGFRGASIPFQVPVRGYFAGINRRATRYCANRYYREAIVLLTR